MSTSHQLLEVSNLGLSVEGSEHRPVDGVSFSVERGQAFGIVGESGSGKTLTTRSVLHLLPRGVRINGGSIMFDGTELVGLGEAAMRGVRGARIALIPQNPGASLNPLIPVWRQIAAPMRAHGIARRAQLSKVVSLLDQLGLVDPERVAQRYPHQLSGGMQQRVVAAASLAAEPELLIADEPTTGLDPLVRVQFINLLKKIQSDRGTAILFVTHDLGVIARLCDRVAVMYGGRIMEQGPVRATLGSPQHPYTQGLLRATPDIARQHRTVPIPGRPPLGAVIGDECPFAPRCEFVHEVCVAKAPAAYVVGEDHESSCWLHADRATERSVVQKVAR